MHILSLETSTKSFSLAVSDSQKVLRSKNILTERILESSMITSIDGLVKSCGLKFKGIDVLAIGLGPGSFTGLRVGLATVKAFALATNKKVVGVSSLDVVASAVADQEADEICVLMDARRGKVYAAIYDINKNTFEVRRKTDYLLTMIDDVLNKVYGTTLFVGDGITLYQKTIEEVYQAYNRKKAGFCRPLFADEKFWYPQSKELAKLAWKRVEEKKFDHPGTLVPIYLYPQDCQVQPAKGSVS
jgi:tRNA threonylcarbamoyladenosine biosynthesis protein TsaB